jgi:hypothetical protein
MTPKEVLKLVHRHTTKLSAINRLLTLLVILRDKRVTPLDLTRVTLPTLVIPRDQRVTPLNLTPVTLLLTPVTPQKLTPDMDLHLHCTRVQATNHHMAEDQHNIPHHSNLNISNNNTTK